MYTISLLSTRSQTSLLDRTVRHTLSPGFGLRTVAASDWEDFFGQTQSSRPWLAVVAISRLPGSEPAVALRRAAPTTTLVLWSDSDLGDVAKAARLVRVGYDGVYEEPATPSEAQKTLAVVLREGIARRSTVMGFEAVRQELPDILGQFVEELWVRCRRPISPEHAAQSYKWSQSTLGRHLAGAGLPPIGKLIVWGRLIHAATLIGSAHATVEATASFLGFRSAASLRNQLKRYVGVATTDIRASGAESVNREFMRRLLDGDWSVGGKAEDAS